MQGLCARIGWCLLVLFLAGVSAEAGETDQLIKKLDDNYYYPQTKGLKRVSAEIHWESLDPLADEKKYLANPEVKFIWDRSRGSLDSQQLFSLLRENSVSSDRQKQILRFFENYREVIIPETLMQRFKGYESQVQGTTNHLIMRFESKNARRPVRRYDLMVDTKAWHIRKMRIYPQRGIRNIVTELRYVQKDAKWLMAESRAEFEMNGVEMEEISEFYYKKVKGVWLLSRMDQRLKREDKIVQSYIFRIHDYKLN